MFEPTGEKIEAYRQDGFLIVERFRDTDALEVQPH